jgi:hypothetical protein
VDFLSFFAAIQAASLGIKPVMRFSLLDRTDSSDPTKPLGDYKVSVVDPALIESLIADLINMG